MMGNAHDIRPDHRRRKAHLNRAFLKKVGWHELANRHRRRRLRQSLKEYRG